MKTFIVKYKIAEICSLGSNQHKASIGWPIYASISLNVLTCWIFMGCIKSYSHFQHFSTFSSSLNIGGPGNWNAFSWNVWTYIVNQCHGCWWPGDIRSQDISSHTIGWVLLEYRAANQYGTSVFCTDFTCKIREYEFGLQNMEIELCQFCHLRYHCQNKAYLFWVANQSRFVVFYALKPSNTSLITKTFILRSSTCSSNTCSSSLRVPVVPK